MNRQSSAPVIIIIVSIVLVSCLCLCAVAVAAFFIVNIASVDTNGFLLPHEEPTPGNTPVVIRPTIPASTPFPQSTTLAHTPGAPVATQSAGIDPEANLEHLGSVEVPIRDPYDLALRLEGKEGVSPTLDPPAAYRQAGERDTFWVSETNTNEQFQVDATLEMVTDHAYFWVADGIDFRQSDLEALAQTFEAQIYPTNRAFFGSEWTPGVDGDPHIYILYTGGLGGSVAGYFSSTDSINPAIDEYSNGHEMFLFNADLISLDEEYTYGVLAHEFQHMILWYQDRNESTWMNEGLSELATFLNGYDTGGHDSIYALNPDIQMNDWPDDDGETYPHYGASFLYMTYLLDHLGDELLQALIAYPADDFEGIDRLLAERNVLDPVTGSPVTADETFRDWTLASFLQDGSISDGRYTYHNYPQAPQPDETETIYRCDDEEFQTRDVRQYAVDYIRLACSQDVTLNFEGSIQANLLPAGAHSGNYAFWSNLGDESDMTLTRRFDFSEQEGRLTLNYWTWYDIEEDYDYAYVLASEDGEQWEILFTPSGSAEDPTGANFGWGYSGTSGGGPRWVEESVEISQFAGKEIYLRFEYITDAALNGEGILVDDISIPEAGYFSDFENDDGGWDSAGFARVHNVLPQNFLVTVVTVGEETTVTPIVLSADNSAQIPLKFDRRNDQVILVISGATRFTRQPAAYRFRFEPSP
jgi:hypothetical protein